MTKKRAPKTEIKDKNTFSLSLVTFSHLVFFLRQRIRAAVAEQIKNKNTKPGEGGNIQRKKIEFQRL